MTGDAQVRESPATVAIRDAGNGLLAARWQPQPATRLFAAPRFIWYAAAAALGCAILTLAAWPILHSGRAGHHCLDFNWIWLTGKLAASGAAVQVYHPGAALPRDVATLSQFHCAGTPGDGRFDYPPTVLFFTYPLGFLPYFAAMAVWIGATLTLYLWAVCSALPRAAAAVAALTTYPAALNILIGHNGFLTAGLFGLALVSIERRPWLAGLFLGLLTYKPQLGLLIPLALLASRNWRAFAAASLASVAFAVAAALAFGDQLWPLFLSGLGEEAGRLSDHQAVSPIIFPTIRGILRDFGAGVPASWAGQAVVSAAVAAAIWVLWSRPVAYSLKAAALAVATLAAAPYALSYDYCILSVAAAFLVRDGLARGFLRGERTVMLLCWAGLSFFGFAVAIFAATLTGRAGLGGDLLYGFLACLPLVVCGALFAVVIVRARLPDPPTGGEPFGRGAVLSGG